MSRRPIEQLGRLNPSTARFDIGFGGLPQIQNIDLAGALAMTGEQIGACLLQLQVLGFGIPGTLQTVLHLVEALVHEEQQRRLDLQVDAELQALMGLDDTVEIRQHQALRLVSWPQDKERIGRLIAMAVHELVEPHTCWACGGKGPQTRFGRQLMSLRKLREGMTTEHIVAAVMPRYDVTDKLRDRKATELAGAVERQLAAWVAGGLMRNTVVKVPYEETVKDKDGAERTVARERTITTWFPSCRQCNGTGRRARSAMKEADFLGLSMTGWKGANTSHAFLEWLRGELDDRIAFARSQWARVLDTPQLEV